MPASIGAGRVNPVRTPCYLDGCRVWSWGTRARVPRMGELRPEREVEAAHEFVQLGHVFCKRLDQRDLDVGPELGPPAFRRTYRRLFDGAEFEPRTLERAPAHRLRTEVAIDAEELERALVLRDRLLDAALELEDEHLLARVVIEQASQLLRVQPARQALRQRRLVVPVPLPPPL